MKLRYHIPVIMLLLCLPMILTGQGFFQKITQPDGVGGKVVATHLDGLGSSTSFGPGLDVFVRYNLGQQGFVTVGTGYRTITDKAFSMDVVKVTMLPTFELQGGYNLLKGQSISPFVKGGLQAFGSSTTMKLGGNTVSSETFYDVAGFAGGGLAFDINEKLKLQASGDYRYVFTAEGNPKPKHWVAQVGLTYALRPSNSRPKGEELEYDFGQDELALDDLFQDESTDLDDLFGDLDSGSSGSSGSSNDMNEDDALALLFSPEEEASSAMDLNDPLYSETPEVNELLSRIEYMKTEMEKRNQQISELQNVVRANERAIAEISGQVVGDFAGYASEQSFGVVDASGFKGSYEQGLQQFYNKKYTEAIRLFQGLLSSNPDHRLASNCRYWIGEAYNAMGNHREAINAFSAVMRYRNSYKFDDALLMNGICHMKMGDKNSARENFQELVSRYPDSEYAPKAMRYLGML